MTKANQRNRGPVRRKRKSSKSGKRKGKRARYSVEQREATTASIETNQDVSASSTTPSIDPLMVTNQTDIEDGEFTVPFDFEEIPNLFISYDFNESFLDRGSGFYWNARYPNFHYLSSRVDHIHLRRRTAYYLPGGTIGPSYITCRRPISWMYASSNVPEGYYDFPPGLEEYDNGNGAVNAYHVPEEYSDKKTVSTKWDSKNVENLESQNCGLTKVENLGSPNKVESLESPKWGPKKVENLENPKWGPKKVESLEDPKQVQNLEDPKNVEGFENPNCGLNDVNNHESPKWDEKMIGNSKRLVECVTKQHTKEGLQNISRE